MRTKISLNLFFFFTAFYVCFKHLFLSDNLFYFIFCLLFINIFFMNTIKIKRDLWWIGWGLLILDMFFSITYAYKPVDALKFSLVYLLFLIFSIYFTRLDCWWKIYFKWMRFFLFVHMYYTLFSVIFTKLSIKISSYILPEEAQELTVRWIYEDTKYAGISGQIGTNAFFFSVLIGLMYAGKLKKKSYNKLYLLLASISLLLTGKKGLIIASLISIIVVYILQQKVYIKRKNMYCFCLFLLVLLMCFGMVFSETIYLKIQSSVDSRINLYLTMIDLIKEKPLLGIGTSSIGAFTYKNRLGHNIYIQMLSEQGIIGFILLVFTMLWPLIISVKRYRFLEEEKEVVLFGIYIQVFIIIYGFFGNPIYDYNIVLVYLLSLAAVFSINKKFYKDKNLEGEYAISGFEKTI